MVTNYVITPIIVTARKGYKVLEPCDRKLSCTVLIGERGSNPSDLLDKISEGKTKKQALKCVQRRLVNIVFRVIKHNVPYVNPPVEKVSAEALKDKKS